MSSSKEYLDYVLEQLEMAGFSDVRSRLMMGEYLLYVDSVLVGGVYDDRLLVKKVAGNGGFGMKEAVPYSGAKSMWLVGEVDDIRTLAEIIKATMRGLEEA